MKLVCPNNCDAGRYENVGFRLVGVPVTVNEDLTVDVDGVHSAIVNIYRGLIPGAKLLCARCHEKTIIEE